MCAKRAPRKKAPVGATAGGTTAAGNRVFTCIRSVVEVEQPVFGADQRSRSMAMSTAALPPAVDHREPWWEVGDQKRTGACVGWAVGAGLIRWFLTKKQKLSTSKNDQLSVRYFWMAAKEMDEFQMQPTTFLEDAGTSILTALDVVQKFGCVRETILPIDGTLYANSSESFFSIADQLRIDGMTRIRKDPALLRQWLADEGPIAARLEVDQNFFDVRGASPQLDQYNPFPDPSQMGHAVVLVGYRTDGTFIIRNSWGTNWGDGGFAYATENYIEAAFSEFFGVYF